MRRRDVVSGLLLLSTLFANILLVPTWHRTFAGTMQAGGEASLLAGTPVFFTPYFEITNGRRESLPIRTGVLPTLQSLNDSIAVLSGGKVTGKSNGKTAIIGYDPVTGLYDTCTVLVVPWVVGASELIVDTTLAGLRADAVSGDTIFFQGGGAGYSYNSLYTASLDGQGKVLPVVRQHTVTQSEPIGADLMKVHPTPQGNFLVDTRRYTLDPRDVSIGGPLLQNLRTVGQVYHPVGDTAVTSWILPHGMDHDFDNNVYIGEYNVQSTSLPADYRVKIYKGSAGGTQWDVAYAFPPRNEGGITGGIRHVHAVQTDPYSGDIWIATGDFNAQSRIYFHTNHLLPDPDGVVRLSLAGSGSQQYRTVSFGFTQGHIYWFMDAPTDTQKIFRIRRAGAHPLPNGDGTYTAEHVATVGDKPFYNNCRISTVGPDVLLLETMYENAAQYGTSYRELDDRNRLFLLRETPAGDMQVQQVASARAAAAFAPRIPVGQLSNGRVILAVGVREQTHVWATQAARLLWTNASLKPFIAGSSVSVGFDDLGASIRAAVTTGGAISAWEVRSAPPVMPLPPGVDSVAPYYWDIQAANAVFTNGMVSLAMNKLQGLGPDSLLTVLLQTDSGWIDLGGAVANGFLAAAIGTATGGKFTAGVRHPSTPPPSPPPAPPILLAPVNAATGIQPGTTVRWGSSQGALSYRLQVSADSTFTVITLIDTAGSDTACIPPGLRYSTKYFWRVSAGNSGGVSSWSSVWRFTTAAPPVPLLLSPANGATKQAVNPLLRWRRAAGAAVYRVQLSTSSSFPLVNLIDMSLRDTSVQVGPLTINMTYYWRVLDTIDGVPSNWSGVWTFKTTNAAPPPAPTLLSPANLATGLRSAVTLAWKSSRGATGYRVQVATDTLFRSGFLADTTTGLTSYVADSLKLNTAYFWRVGAIGPGGTGQWSATRKFTTGSIAKPGYSAAGPDGDNGPASFQLGQNYPNPFNPSTVIHYALPEENHVVVAIYNLLGQEVARLVDERQQPGLKEVTWNAEGVNSGIYFCRMQAGEFSDVKKLILLR